MYRSRMPVHSSLSQIARMERGGGGGRGEPKKKAKNQLKGISLPCPLPPHMSLAGLPLPTAA